MAKIDRLGWADGMTFSAYGVRFGVRVNEPRVLESLIERFPPGTEPATARTVDHLYSVTGFPTDSNGRIRKFNLGYWNLYRFARSRSFDELLNLFESHLQLTVAEYAPRRIFVHAGVVGWNGRAILIPGVSYSGKTTLVDQLIRRGATYYSDEYAVLDQQGRVHPYPRALGLRSPGSQPATRMQAEEIGVEIGSKPLRIGLVLSTRFKAGSRWRPRELTRGKGVLELMSNAVAARSQPELALSVLPKALESAKILKGVRGEASEIVESILR